MWLSCLVLACPSSNQAEFAICLLLCCVLLCCSVVRCLELLDTVSPRGLIKYVCIYLYSMNMSLFTVYTQHTVYRDLLLGLDNGTVWNIKLMSEIFALDDIRT